MDEICCIYCGTKENLSISDIILDSITTAKCTNRNVCKKCNNYTNTDFENEFSKYFAYFRNKLDYRNRRSNKPIPCEIAIYVNKNITNRNKPSYTKSFTTSKKFKEDNFIFDDKMNVLSLENADKKFTKLKYPKVLPNHNIDYKKLFLSNITLKTVAKICYEWHCKK